MKYSKVDAQPISARLYEKGVLDISLHVLLQVDDMRVSAWTEIS